MRLHRSLRLAVLAAALFGLAQRPGELHAQVAGPRGTVRGVVTQAGDQAPLADVVVTLGPVGPTTRTDGQGRFEFLNVPPGTYELTLRWSIYPPSQRSIEVAPGATVESYDSLEPRAIALSEIMVVVPAREPQPAMEAAAAVAVVDRGVQRGFSPTGQAPLALAGLPGVEVVQTGVNEFNVNTRGFNSSLNRHVLVLQDGRDLSVPFLGSQEWEALSLPIEDMDKIEMIRGPGSALYGANAFAGVLSMTTPAAREVVGGKVSVSGGTLSSMSGDARYATVFAAGRVGVRTNAGFRRSDSWTRSRTNLGDLGREYTGAVDTTRYPVRAPVPGYEARPLNGQVAPVVPGPASGEAEPLDDRYGSLRIDRYFANRSVATLEGGTAQISNEVRLTTIGRTQVLNASRPWARVAYSHPSVHLTAWYSGRRSLDGQYSLTSGQKLEEVSHIAHAEAQWQGHFMVDRGHVVLGGSARAIYADSRGSFILPEDDARKDEYYSTYGQLEYEVTSKLRVSGAARWDDGNLFPHQYSARGGAVFTPSASHSIRVGVGRAFQTPATLEFVLGTTAARPLNLQPVEQAMRAAFGPAMAGVPAGTLFTTSSSVPVLARGNKDLDVERVFSLELGYKGQLLDGRVYVTADGYHSRLRNFVTDLLPGVNPAYGLWTAPTTVAAAARAPLEQAVRNALTQSGAVLAAAGLTRMPDGTTAVVLSYGQAGRATESGVEIGTGLRVNDRLSFDGTFTWFDASVDASTFVSGDQIAPNTPSHRGSATVTYDDGRLDVRGTLRLVDGFLWNAGIYQGHVPRASTVDAAAGYQVNGRFRVFAVGTNLLDQRRYQMFGGSLVGRRVLGGVTATF